MFKEMKAFWDKKTLLEYLTLERVPQGLRIKKFPTFEFNDDNLRKQWTDILTNCSFELMRIIINSKMVDIDRLQLEISNIKN